VKFHFFYLVQNWWWDDNYVSYWLKCFLLTRLPGKRHLPPSSELAGREQTRKRKRVRLEEFRITIFLMFVVDKSSLATSFSPPPNRWWSSCSSPFSVIVFRTFVCLHVVCVLSMRACVRAPFPAISSGSVNIFVYRPPSPSSSLSSGSRRQWRRPWWWWWLTDDRKQWGREPPREKFYRPSEEKFHSPYQQQQLNNTRKRKNQ